MTAYKLVALGGGTGLSVLLNGVRNYYPKPFSKVSAIVAVSDDGGSTGKLRKEYQDLPAPGDIRKSLIALAKHQQLMQQIFSYRFKHNNSQLNGHSLGNLILTALWDITGSFSKAIEQASQLLNTIGDVIPLTEQSVTLVARFDTGVTIHGEDNIYRYGKLKKGKIQQLWLEPQDAPPSPKALTAIREADIIIIGPGSLYTSIIASFLLQQVKEAIIKSKATKIYISNLLTDYGETYGFDAFDHLKTLETYLVKRTIDYTVVNTAPIPAKVLKIYRTKEAADYVPPALHKFKKKDREVITGDFVKVVTHPSNKRIRHDADAVLRAIIKTLNLK